MKSKIEPNCLARIVNSVAGNNGVVVRVIKYLGDIDPTFPIKDYWEIDKTLPGADILGRPSANCNWAPESQLQRIDENRKPVAWEDCEFIPEEIKESL